MDKYIKVGIGVMILDGNKILLGHRAKDKKDTGGIYEVDWQWFDLDSLPEKLYSPTRKFIEAYLKNCTLLTTIEQLV